MTDTNSFGAQVKAWRKSQRLSQHELAKVLGVAQATVSDWESERYVPPMDKMLEIAERLWLKGDAPKTGGRPSIYAGITGDTVSIPMFDVSAAAGDGSVVNDAEPESYWPLPKKFVELVTRAPGQLVLINVTGDSMQPTLKSGDRILVDTSRINPAIPGIYVIAIEDMAVVKRLEIIPGTKPTKVRMASDNPLHPSYEIPLDDVRVLGSAVAVIGRL